MTLIYLSIIVLSAIGLGFTAFKYIMLKKQNLAEFEKLQANDPILQIKKSLFLDIPIKKIIIGCFAITIIVYAVLTILQTSLPELELGILALTVIILLLFIYEFSMKLFTFGEFCLWCLVGIIVCTINSFLIVEGKEVSLIYILQRTFEYSLTVHLLGVVLGLGGTTVVDLMFFHFIKNFKLAPEEAGVMHLISQLIILGLILLIVSGLALFFTDVDRYLENPRFLMKMTTVLVVIMNGALLNLYITPKLKKISFLNVAKERKYEPLKHIAFAAGAISIVSWYSSFFFAMIKDLENFSYTTLLIAYLILLGTAIGGSQIAKIYFEKKASSQTT